tara:strand:+ start:31 stop:219 length:189 start_codon:yes stop_codon:yes gene_type:complete
MRVLIYYRQEKNKKENKVSSICFIILYEKLQGTIYLRKIWAKALRLKLLDARMTKHYEVPLS